MHKFYYWGPLLYHTEITEEHINKIKSLCNNNKNIKNDVRKELAGHIKEEYSIDKHDFSKIISSYLNEYQNAFNHWYGVKLKSLEVTSTWVNFMKAGEFNPPHIHTECDLSCVIYLDIPEELKKENEQYLGTLNKGGPGSISFLYGEDNDHIISMVNSFPKKGDFFIFPRTLKHFVFPFKSNVERISVSSNFKILKDEV
jgi:uncharacterized protein (TIGR02466 family)